MEDSFVEIDPRIELYFEVGIDFFKNHRLDDSVVIEQLLHFLWNETFLENEKSKIFDYKQEYRAKKYIINLLLSYRIDQVSNNLSNLGNILYSLNGVSEKEGIDSLKSHYENIYDWFSWEYIRVFSDIKLKDEILESIEKFSLENFNQDIMMKIVIQGNDMDKIQPLVRAYQSLMNNKYYEYEGKMFSHSSQESSKSLLEYSRGTHEGISNFLLNAQKGYSHISGFFEWEQSKNKKSYNNRCKIIDEMEGIDKKRLKELKKDFIEIYQRAYHVEYSSIIRHAFDWIVRVAPDSLYKKEPIVIFAIIVLLVEKLHADCGKKFLPKKFEYILIYDLREYILEEKKNVNMKELESHAANVLSDMLYMMPDDIEPLFFFPVISTEKKEKELRRIWSDLKVKIKTIYETY